MKTGRNLHTSTTSSRLLHSLLPLTHGGDCYLLVHSGEPCPTDGCERKTSTEVYMHLRVYICKCTRYTQSTHSPVENPPTRQARSERDRERKIAGGHACLGQKVRRGVCTHQQTRKKKQSTSPSFRAEEQDTSPLRSLGLRHVYIYACV